MNSSERTLARAGLGAALSLALLATPCAVYADEAASPSSDAASSAAASDEAAQPALFIGHEGETVEVPCAAEATPDALIAALAEETGWNLDLAGDVEVNGNEVVIPLAQDSVIYTGAADGVDAAYATDDREDLIYTVLNSVATTIWSNTPYYSVRFCAPDGGPIEIEGDGFSFYLSNYASWYEPNIAMTNEPLPSDSIGACWPTPSGGTIAGWQALNIVFVRGDVEPGEGTIAVVDSEGSVVDEIDVSDPERVFVNEMSKETRGSYNLKDGTFITVKLDKPLAPNETYEVQVDEGAFVYDGTIASEAMTDGAWPIETCGFGLGATSDDDSHVTVGEQFTEEYLLDDTVEKATIVPSDPEACELSATELTESGTVTYTPLKAGNLNCVLTFYLTDGTTYQVSIDYVVDEA